MDLRRTASIVAVTAALAWLVGMASGVRSQASGRLSDFAAFYAGGRLVGTGELYDARQLQRIEKESTGRSSPAHGFVRPPFHALIFWPLGQLPYNTAEVVWVVFSGIGLWGFVWLWPIADLKQRWILVCLSLPAAIGLANGQDSALILLAVTFAAALHRSNRPLAAGVVFSICAVKAHLFLLLPVLLIRRREYRFSAGWLTGGCALFVISTIAEGWQWPVRIWNSATDPASTPSPGLMPNLAGALHGVPGGRVIYALLFAVLAAVLWRALLGAPFYAGLAATIAASLPLAPHSYLPDCVLLLPAVCEAICRERRRDETPHASVGFSAKRNRAASARVRHAAASRHQSTQAGAPILGVPRAFNEQLLKATGYILATPLPFGALFLGWPYSVLTPLTIAVFAVLIARSTSAVSRTPQSAACPKQGPSTVSP